MESRTLLCTFIKYTSANILGMIGLSCYILADTFFIARGLGENGLTALNLAIPVFSFISGCGLMTGMGGGTWYSIFCAEGNFDKAQVVFSHALFLMLLFSIIFVPAGAAGSSCLATVLGAKGSVHPMTSIYLQVILLFSPAFILNNIILCFVRNDGLPRLSMAAMLAGSLSNILLDYIFIFPLGMGIAGAAIATGAAPLISLFLLSFHFRKKNCRLRPCKTRPSLALSSRIISAGASSFITEAASGVVIIAFNFIILNLAGNTGVAAYGVIANLSLVVTSVFTGVAQGMQPVVSRCYGSGNRDGAHKTFYYGIVLSLILAVSIYLLLAVFRMPLSDLFNKEQNPALSRMAEQGILLYFTAFPFAGINIISAVMLSSAQRPGPAFLISILRGFVLILPCALVLSLLFQMTGVWLSFPVTEVLICAISLLFIHRRPAGR